MTNRTSVYERKQGSHSSAGIRDIYEEDDVDTNEEADEGQHKAQGSDSQGMRVPNLIPQAR
jgi:hypothetical protein